jgi:hypothetical protein
MFKVKKILSTSVIIYLPEGRDKLVCNFNFLFLVPLLLLINRECAQCAESTVVGKQFVVW